jgi:hypothetical protein
MTSSAAPAPHSGLDVRWRGAPHRRIGIEFVPVFVLVAIGVSNIGAATSSP